MKLLLVTDSRDGVLFVGCRAEGVYKGRRIERTAWSEGDDFPSNIRALEQIAAGQYKTEMKKIDSIKEKP